MVNSPSFERKAPNVFIRILKLFFFQLLLFLKYRNIHVVYAACGHSIDLFALMKKLHLYSGKLFCVIHHPSKVFFSNMYEKIICISTYTQNYLINNGLSNTEYIFWGPDLSFYAVEADSEKVYDFYSNGKSFRDFDLLKRLDTPYKILALNQKSRVSAKENVTLCTKSRVMLIPVCANVRGIVGLTSVCDALALGMPILISDSAHIGIDVEKLGIGFEYKAGDIDDMKKKMKLILDKKTFASLSEKSKRFGETFTYDSFAIRIQSMLLTALEEKTE